MATVDNLNIKISTDSKDASKEIDNLINKLNQLNGVLTGMKTSNLTGLANSLKGASNGIKVVGSTASGSGQKVNSFFSALTKNSNSSGIAIKGLNTKVLNMASAWGTFYASMYPIIRLLEKVKSAVNDSMDYVETYNYFNVTMDKIGKESGETYVNSFKDSVNALTQKMTGFNVGSSGELTSVSGTNLGLDPNTLMNFQAKIGAVTSSVGLLGQTSTDTEKALSMLSADLSSLTNTDLSTVMTNLQSGLIGQSRALYKYGIDITSTTLQEYALANGITKRVSAMSQSEKMQLRILAILDQSKIAWGDQANTLNSVANQYRILQQQMSNLGRVIGNLFLPVVQKVLPYINAMVIALRELIGLFGVSLFGNNWLTDIMDGISSGYSGISDDMEDLADSEDDASDSAKKLKSQLLGIDELNNLTTSSSSSSSSGGDDFDLSGAISDALADYESVWEKAFANAENKAQEMAERIVNAFKKGGFEGLGEYIGSAITKGLKKIKWEKVYKTVSSWAKNLADFMNGLISPELFGALGDTLAGAINVAIESYKGWWTEFDGHNFGLAVAEFVNETFKNIKAKDLADGMNAFADTMLDALGTAISNISWGQVIGKIGEFLGNLETDTILFFAGVGLIKNFGGNFAKMLLGSITSAITIDATAWGTGISATIDDLLCRLSNAGLIKIPNISIKNGLKVAVGLTIAIDGIKNVVLGMTQQSFKKRLAGELELLAGVSVAFGTAGFEIAFPLIVTFELGFEFANAYTNSKAFKESVDKVGEETASTMTSGQASANQSFHVLQTLIDYFKGLKTSSDDAKDSVDKADESIKNFGNNKSLFDDLDESINNTNNSLQNMDNESLFSDLIGKIDNTDSSLTKCSISASGMADNIVSAFGGLSERISPAIESVKTTITNGFSSAKTNVITSLNALSTGIKTPLNTILAFIETCVNGVVKGVNVVINALNSLSFTVPDWIPIIGGKQWTFNLTPLNSVSIPRLATGGMVDNGQLFIARESGAEMVGNMGNRTTVANNEQIVAGISEGVREAVADALVPYLNKLVDNTNDIADKDIAVSSDGIFKSVRNSARIYEKSTGVNAFAF